MPNWYSTWAGISIPTNASLEVMTRLFFMIAVGALTGLLVPGAAHAQIVEQCPHLNPLLPARQRITTSRSVREQLIKLCIKENKEDFEKLVERTEEIAVLSTEIRSSFEETKAFSNDDRDKLERVESLVKKVRSELRASKEDKTDKKPESVTTAVRLLQESSSSLLSEIKKTTRHSISLVAVKSSNAVMRIVKFLKDAN